MAASASTGESSRETRTVAIDAEVLAGKRFPYQEDISLVSDIDLLAATPGPDINWLEDITLLEEDGVPAVFDRYSNSFLKIYFPIPAGREDEIARKVLVRHLTEGNSYGTVLKSIHCKVPPGGAGPVGGGLPGCGYRLEAAGARGLGGPAGPLRPAPEREAERNGRPGGLRPAPEQRPDGPRGIGQS